ncbi:lysostaphin resistance A-like protein [Patescibacteria group bacterium]
MRVSYDTKNGKTLKERLQINWENVTDFKYWRNTGVADEDGAVIHKRIHRPIVQKIAVVVTVLIADLIYNGFMIQVLIAILGQEVVQHFSFWGWMTGQNVVLEIQTMLMSNLLASIIFACIVAPGWEEPTFRWYWFRKKLRNRDEDAIRKPKVIEQLGRKSMYPIVIISSIIFGLAHGGPINLFLQGVGGFLLSYVYFKNGRCLASAMWLHALFNGTLIFFEYTGAWNGAVIGVTLPYWVFLSRLKAIFLK